MSRLLSGSVKGAGTLLVLWLSQINDMFSPLFWVLLALVFVDLVLNIHKEGQQFQKLGSAAMAMGIPGFISSNIAQPGFARVLVAMMCLVYIQSVVPQLAAALPKIRFSKDPAQQAVDAALVEQIAQLVAAKAQTSAQQVVDSAKFAGTSGTAATPVPTEGSKGAGA